MAIVSIIPVNCWGLLSQKYLISQQRKQFSFAAQPRVHEQGSNNLTELLCTFLEYSEALGLLGKEESQITRTLLVCPDFYASVGRTGKSQVVKLTAHPSFQACVFYWALSKSTRSFYSEKIPISFVQTVIISFNTRTPKRPWSLVTT